MHATRVFSVQRAFTELEGQMHGPGELAEATGLDDSTVHRILQSGIYDGTFVREARGLYRLGSGAARLGLKALMHEPNAEVAHAALEKLRKDTDGGLVFLFGLAPFSGARKQCLDMAVGDSDLSELGLSHRTLLLMTQSLRTGASGQAILAYLPEVIQEEVLAEPSRGEAERDSRLDEAEMLASLKQVRELGVATETEECMPGWSCCAAPVSWDGIVMGSVAVFKPRADMPRWSASMIHTIRRAAAEFTQTGDWGGWTSRSPRTV
ncbi:IclR family transcriptional regulator [Streptomyces apocyni]|uniref:IclR family transcriptional regulator n=1 Tax=Streptomyces apocyni TaxID=2654677 RepID=UPI001E6082F5|nr:IclR family transcriptional regulator C-terminal domain-containing protein [Streptomyces apocyni]